MPTKIAYVDEGDPIEDEVVHRAVAQLLCSTTNAADFPLKNLTADSAPLPAAFLAALGFGDLSEPRRFSFLDVVFACHNLNTLEGKLSEALESGDGSLPSRDELLLAAEAASLEAALFGSSGLEEILDNLRWRRSEDVLSVPSLACDEDCLQDVECLRPLLGDLLLEFGDVDEALEYARARPEEVMAVVEPGPQQDPFGDSGSSDTRSMWTRARFQTSRRSTPTGPFILSVEWTSGRTTLWPQTYRVPWTMRSAAFSEGELGAWCHATPRIPCQPTRIHSRGGYRD